MLLLNEKENKSRVEDDDETKKRVEELPIVDIINGKNHSERVDEL